MAWCSVLQGPRLACQDLVRSAIFHLVLLGGRHLHVKSSGAAGSWEGALSPLYPLQRGAPVTLSMLAVAQLGHGGCAR